MTATIVSGSAGAGIALTSGIPGSSAGVKIKGSTILRNMNMGIQLSNVSFTLDRSTVAHNVMGGATSIGATYEVTNNFIVNNGNQGLPVEIGGLRVTGSGRVLHNTIAMNNSPPDATYAGGVYCDNGTAANNIIASNQRGNEKLPYAQTRGTCNFTGSMIDMTYTGPAFVDVVAGDFHIASASPAVNAGGIAQVAVDFDGEPRSDGAADLGADERP